MSSEMKTSTDNSNTLVNSLNDEYYVDVILDKRIINNHVEYYVKWTGFTDEYNTWEPIENLHCEKLVEEFENKLAEKKKKMILKKIYSTVTTDKAQSETGPFKNHIKIACSTEQKCDSINKTNRLVESDLAINSEDITISKPDEYVDTHTTHSDIVSEKVIDVVHDSNGQIIQQKYVKEKKISTKKAKKVLRPKIVKKFHKNKIIWNEPEKVIGSLTLNGHLMTLLKWKNVEEPDLIPSKEVNVKWPQLIIQFYEKHLLWPNRPKL